jgi:N-acetylmuramoyl-L-alanine amidase/Secretion system C-terminal sorting domain
LKKQIIILLFLLPIQLLAQISVQKNQVLPISFEQPITSLALQTVNNLSFKNTYIIAENDTIKLQHDADFEGNWRSGLVVFSKPISAIILLSGEIEGKVLFLKNYVKPVDNRLIISQLREITDDCNKPTMIPISTWRQGLTPPKEAPLESKIRQIIVHHSAGSNTATNYVDVVRNIYVYHTQSNGWNDIGYNFLIAQDGTVFEGRDGQGKYEGDNVVGAHFCAKNTGTMGICLLGDYMTAQPTEKSLEALEKLIAWKMKKDNLDPSGKSNNVTSGELLNNISGHQDGCATDCPGDNVYAKMGEIRQKVPQTCNFIKIPPVLATEKEMLDFKVYPNPTSEQIIVESSLNLKGNLYLFDGLGREITIEKSFETQNKAIISAQNLAKGLYLLRLNSTVRKIIIE